MYGTSFLVCPVTKPLYYTENGLEIGRLINSGRFYDKEGRQGGLSGEYYNDVSFDKLIMNRRDSVIDFTWGLSSPGPDINIDNFSVRWTGKIEAPQTGEYTFAVTSDDGSRLWINNQLLIDDWKQHASEVHIGKISLEAGKKYDIKLEYLDIVGNANVKLNWVLPEKPKGNNPDTLKKERQVYLPASATWYDFWTGGKYEGGKNIKAKATIDIIPLFVRSGSVIPVGPEIEYAAEKPADPLEIRIYPGADGSFTLYEDENDNYNYEKGLFATIDFKWDDQDRTLTISDRKGNFPGMLQKRKMNLVIVSAHHGTGIQVCPNPDKTIEYNGKQIILKIQ